MSKVEQSRTQLETGIARETWNHLARENAMHFIASNRSEWKEEEFFETGREMASRLLHEMRPRTGAGTSMCDVGCGIGRLAFAFASYFERVIGLDVSPEMIDRAVWYQKQYHMANVLFRVSNGVDLREVPDSSQDLVVSHLVFLHLTSPELMDQYFHEFSRVLKRGAPAFFDLATVPPGWKGLVLYRIKEVRDRLYRDIYRVRGPRVGTRSPAVRGKRVTVRWLTTALQKASLDLLSISVRDNSWAGSALTSVICKRL